MPRSSRWVSFVAAALATCCAATARAQSGGESKSQPQYRLELETVPRAAMFLPLGVGQFANRQNALGGFFLAVESLSFTTAIATWAYAVDRYPPDRLYSGASGLAALQIVNTLAWSVCGLATVAGVVQANVAYRPIRVLLHPVDALPVAAAVMPMPGGATVVVGGWF